MTWVGGKQVATAGADGVIRVWQLPEAPAVLWATPRELKGHAGAVTALAAMPDGVRLLSGGARGECLHDRQGKCISRHRLVIKHDEMTDDASI